MAVLALAETPIGRVTIRPFFRVFCRFVLYARPFHFLRETSQQVFTTEDISRILQHSKIIAVIPCACRVGKRSCGHPLHKEHEPETCISVGLAAVLQIGSGIGRRINADEVQALCQRASESGLVHHAVYSMGALLEICSCCPETCAAIRGYRSGIPEAVRPSKYIAARGPECNGCSSNEVKICEAICPYGKAPSDPECLGCGLCARHCPQKAIRMIPRAAADTEERR